MTKIGTITNSIFDRILPVFGQPAMNLPVWNEGQKMFIADEYESAAGNRYYKGIRFCDRLAIVETVGNYHTWTYIDNIEVYSFDGGDRHLIGKRQYDKQFYNQDFIKSEAKEMVREYVLSQMKLSGETADDDSVKEYAGSLVDRSYTSILDMDCLPRLQQMLPVLMPQP